MKQGDVFLSGTALDFKSPHARAAVISSLKGRFVLTSSEKGQAKILPAANNISSRSGALINKVDLQNHFSGKYLIIDKLKLEIGNQNFPMNEKNFFYLSYSYEGEIIRKKLDYDGDFLVFDKSEIFKIDGEPIPVQNKEMNLYYRNGETSELVNEFSPVFPDLVELKEEVNIILEEFNDKSRQDKINEITAYLTEFHGKPNKENLSAWLTLEFGL
jgi:hypothetical protein